MVVGLLQVRIYEQIVCVNQQRVAVGRGARHCFGRFSIVIVVTCA
jgi:hypothetical protein